MGFLIIIEVLILSIRLGVKLSLFFSCDVVTKRSMSIGIDILADLVWPLCLNTDLPFTERASDLLVILRRHFST